MKTIGIILLLTGSGFGTALIGALTELPSSPSERRFMKIAFWVCLLCFVVMLGTVIYEYLL